VLQIRLDTYEIRIRYALDDVFLGDRSEIAPRSLRDCSEIVRSVLTGQPFLVEAGAPPLHRWSHVHAPEDAQVLVPSVGCRRFSLRGAVSQRIHEERSVSECIRRVSNEYLDVSRRMRRIRKDTLRIAAYSDVSETYRSHIPQIRNKYARIRSDT
jgi:hypothetical protein